MNSLSGGELFDQISDEDYKMTEAEVIHYIRQVCEGLCHMHEQNIVHLDVKVTTPARNYFISVSYFNISIESIPAHLHLLY